MQRRHDGLNIPIEVLRSFVAILESGSFTGAAEALQLTQPAISAQIKRLQQFVGGEVFVKSRQGVSLTDRGEMVSRYARRILAMNDQILSLSGLGNCATIRVGMPIVFGARFLTDVIAACQSRSDDQIRFSCDSAADLNRKFANGYLDVALLLSVDAIPKRAVAQWQEPLLWICAPDFRLKPGAPIPLLSLPNGLSDQVAVEALEGAGLKYSMVFCAPDFAAHLHALRSGLGLFVVPERIVPRDLKIASELPSLPECRVAICVREDAETQSTRAVADAMAGVLGPAAAA